MSFYKNFLVIDVIEVELKTTTKINEWINEKRNINKLRLIKYAIKRPLETTDLKSNNSIKKNLIENIR